MAVATTESPSLARYVPRISAEWELTTSEPWQEIDGTLCYVDISGFTSLSEKLARRGRIGAEELTEVLNYVFGKMMAVAYERAGSLLKFGGDALLLMFTGSGHQTQAASAAVEMQEVLREARSYETSAGHLDLKMSVGLHSGMIHLFRVGGPHKELILTGPVASMTTEMEETAVAGEILISSATKAAIPDGPETAKGNGWLLTWRKARIECCGWIPRAELDPEAFAESMPVALRKYLQHGAAEPEHHIATVGFIKYEGVDALMEQDGPAAVAEALDELVRNVQEAVDEEGVTFLASDIDQDGGKIIIVAGVPGVQVDDEGRVLRAARRIADNAGTLSLRIGINQGHVFVGEIGTDVRATYTIMGDTVNLAARLMAAASSGEVYASPSVLDKSLTLFETAPLEPFHVKGKEQLVQAYAVGAGTGRRPSRKGGALPFAGRAEELQRLHSLIDDLFAGKGNGVAITGERGIGKSRLVDEILPTLERAIHIDIRAEPYGVGTPYRPLRDPVRRLLGIARAEHDSMADELQEAVDAFIPDQGKFAPLLADVAMIEMPSTPEVDQIDPKFRQDRTADLLIELFMQVCSGPVFFEVEDGHYMDEASSHVMERLAAATTEKPWLVLTTRRDTGGGFDPRMEEIHLGPLSDSEARQLVLVATEAAPLRPHDVDVIVQRAGGLPLFLEEIIGAVRKAGGVESLPDSLDAVVSAQIDALPPLARRLLQFSSVLGRSFRVSILNELVEDQGVRMDRATRKELTGFLESDGADRLQFRHSIIRDVAYRSLSFKRRQALHIRAGEIAEAAAGDSPESVADVLALHFSLGLDHIRAWRYSRIAGDQAREAYANVDAAAHYTRALESARRLDEFSDDERAEVWTKLGDVHERAGLFEAALDAYRRASQLRKGTVARAELMLKRASAREKAAQYSMALRETTGARRLLESSTSEEADVMAARAAAFYSVVRMRQGRPVDALRTAKGAVEEATEANAEVALARAYGVMAWANLMLDEPDAGKLWGEALRLYERAGDLVGQGYMNANLGGLAYFEGRWDDALKYYERSRDAAERLGNPVDVAGAHANMGEVLVNQHRFDEAEPKLRSAIRVAQASREPLGVIFASLHLGRLLIAQREFPEAEDLLIRSREQARSLNMKGPAYEAAVYLADLRVHNGDPDGALKLLDQAAAEAQEEASIFAPTAQRVRALALDLLGQTSSAVDIADEALDIARGRGLDYEVAMLLLCKASLIEDHQPDTAVSLRDEHRQIVDRLGVRPLEVV